MQFVVTMVNDDECPDTEQIHTASFYTGEHQRVCQIIMKLIKEDTIIIISYAIELAQLA